MPSSPDAISDAAPEYRFEPPGDPPPAHTVVMTELGPFFFHHFPSLLARRRRFHVANVIFSSASRERVERFLNASPFSRLRTMLRAARGMRSLRPIVCYVYLLVCRRRLGFYTPGSSRPIPTDYLCSLGFLRRIPRSQIDAAETSSNVHWSLLPRYAGCHPFYWVFRAGEEESGVTLHRIDERYDHGDILVQRRIRIGADETSADFRRHARRVAIDEFARYLDGKTMFDRLARPQDEAAYEFYDAPTDADRRLDADDEPELIRAKFRAAGPGGCYVHTPDGPRPIVAVHGVGADAPRNARPLRLGDTTVYAEAA